MRYGKLVPDSLLSDDLLQLGQPLTKETERPLAGRPACEIRCMQDDPALLGTA